MKPQTADQPSLQDVRVFVVDDEDILAWSIETELKGCGAEVMRAGSIRQAIDRFAGFNADLAICDLRLPDGNGLELLKKWRRTAPSMPVILVTAHGAIDSAVTALRLGAFDYLQKPFNMQDLIVAVKRASEMSTLRQKVTRMQGVEFDQGEVQIIGSSAPTEEFKRHLRKVAQSRANTVLITGESGSGKELAAQAVHLWSERSQHPFVEINCASIPENLIESELFGFERGAFTDARERKLGLFEVARQGTIFLDEIGEMPMNLQAKLLRALEYRRFRRLGGTKDIEFSARIVAATNRNLLEEVKSKRFRADLYYRLSILPVELPPLRQRMDDIPELCAFLIQKHAKELQLKPCRISDTCLRALMNHPWPGNIRELSNTLQRALVLFEPSILLPEHLRFDDWRLLDLQDIGHQEPPQIAVPNSIEGSPYKLSFAKAVNETLSNSHGPRQGASYSLNGAFHGSESSDLPECAEISEEHAVFALPEEGVKLDDLEKSLLEQAIERAKNNQTKAAKLLGISRHTLRYRMEKHSLLNT